MTEQVKTQRTYLDLTLEQLVFDQDNVRKTSTDIKTLAQNIASIGLIENLVVKKVEKEKFAVVAGSRRLNAIQYLYETKQWKKNTPIKVQLCSDEEATEISLSENLHRQSLNPADEFIAFKTLIDEGQNIDDIAQKHGVTKTVVKKRLKLANLSPILISALQKGEIDLHKAMAFTLSTSHEQQNELYESLKDSYYGFEPDNIRRAITKDEFSSTGSTVLFVGLENYKLAGGTLREDLFEDEIYLIDTDILTKLVNEKIEKTIKDYEAEGWKWVEYKNNVYPYELSQKMRKLDPLIEKKTKEEKDTLEKATKKYKELLALDEPNETQISLIKETEEIIKLNTPKEYYSENMKSISGVYFKIGINGIIQPTIAWVKKEDDPKIKKEKSKENTNKTIEKKPETSAKLKIELAHVNWNILKLELIKNPNVAADLFIFEAISAQQCYTDTLDVNIKKSTYPGYKAETAIMGQSSIIEDYETLIDAIDLSWFDPDDKIKSFKTFRSLDQNTKYQYLALLSTHSLNPSTIDEYKNSSVLAAQAEIKIDTRQHWTPDEVYFKRLNINSLTKIGSELMGEDWTYEARSKKKKEIVKNLHDLFRNDSKYGGKLARKKAKQWCPSEIDHSLVLGA